MYALRTASVVFGTGEVRRQRTEHDGATDRRFSHHHVGRRFAEALVTERVDVGVLEGSVAVQARAPLTGIRSSTVASVSGIQHVRYCCGSTYA